MKKEFAIYPFIHFFILNKCWLKRMIYVFLLILFLDDIELNWCFLIEYNLIIYYFEE